MKIVRILKYNGYDVYVSNLSRSDNPVKTFRV